MSHGLGHLVHLYLFPKRKHKSLRAISVIWKNNFLLFFFLFFLITLQLNGQHNSTFSQLPHTAQLHTLSQCLEQSNKVYTKQKNTERILLWRRGQARLAKPWIWLGFPPQKQLQLLKPLPSCIGVVSPVVAVISHSFPFLSLLLVRLLRKKKM